MKITATGLHGQVVTALVERGTALGIEVVTFGRPTLDLNDTGGASAAIRRAGGDVVVNAAAYTAVDKAESEQDLCMQINAAGAGAVAAGAASLDVPIIQLSTDYVFDGMLERPYREDDPTNPTGAYGKSKLFGEATVAAANPRHVVLRTAWVYSPFGHNFLKTMLRVGETRGEVSVVGDQIGCPTSALDIADAVLAVARRVHGSQGDPALFGLFHLAGTGEATWADFAEAIFERAAENGRPRVTVKRITTADYPTPAKRPGNSRLHTEKLRRVYNVELPDWRTSTRTCVDRVLQTP